MDMQDLPREERMDESYVSQSKLSGNLPVVANHQNVAKPPKGEPTLMSFDEVITMFHEFGHALHGMFSNVSHPTFLALLFQGIL